jgi:gliding motility-associated-like protein
LNWSPIEYLDHPDSLVTLSAPLLSTRYTLVVKDSAGCIARDEILITVNRDKRVYIPNIFLPDSDGKNDNFTVFGALEVAKVRSMQIYDRWGELLFENLNFLPNEPEFGWSGHAKGQAVNPGVYVYVIEVEYVNGETEIFAGDVTVIR